MYSLYAMSLSLEEITLCYIFCGEVLFKKKHLDNHKRFTIVKAMVNLFALPINNMKKYADLADLSGEKDSYYGIIICLCIGRKEGVHACTGGDFAQTDGP